MKNEWNEPDFSNPTLDKARLFGMVAHAAVGQKRKYSGLPYHVHPEECVGILQTLPPESGITLAQQVAMVLHDVVEDTRKFVDEDGNVITKTGSFIKSGRKLFLVEGITLAMVLEEFTDPNDPTFGPEVVRILSGLTDVSMPWDGNREARKALDLAHTTEQAADVKTDKLADILSNAPSIIAHDPGFAPKWMSEVRNRLPVLKDGDPILFAKVDELTHDFFHRRHNQ